VLVLGKDFKGIVSAPATQPAAQPPTTTLSPAEACQ
jgi:hypothetical protein